MNVPYLGGHRGLAIGNLDLKTDCRVARVLTDREGRASGVEYVDANGSAHVQQVRTVILCGYTFEMRASCCSRVTTDIRPGWATMRARLGNTS